MSSRVQFTEELNKLLHRGGRMTKKAAVELLREYNPQYILDAYVERVRRVWSVANQVALEGYADKPRLGRVTTQEDDLKKALLIQKMIAWYLEAEDKEKNGNKRSP